MEDEKQVSVKTADGERLLTEAETKRYRTLLKTQAELESQGFVRTDRIISLKKANTVGNLAILPIVAVIVIIYILINGVNFTSKATVAEYGKSAPIWFFGMFAVCMACFFVHELIHGFFWSLGSRNGWKDIELGFIAKMLTPYCTCKSPISRKTYVFGSLMPMTLLGIVTGIVAIVLGNPFILLFSIIHTFGGAGDILISGMILSDKIDGKEVLIFDHPYDCGYILFEKK